jgi:hypothetical protein
MIRAPSIHQTQHPGPFLKPKKKKNQGDRPHPPCWRKRQEIFLQVLHLEEGNVAQKHQAAVASVPQLMMRAVRCQGMTRAATIREEEESRM